MHVGVSAHDEQVAKRVRIELYNLCAELEARRDQDECRISQAPGVTVFDFFARDGERARVPVGVTTIALLMHQPEKLRRMVDHLLTWAKRQQETARLSAQLRYLDVAYH